MFTKYRKSIVLARVLSLAFLGAGIVGCGSSEQPVRETPQPTVVERLQAVLVQAVIDGLPGVSLAVKGDNVDFSGVAGVEDLVTEVPLNVEHRFYLASVGKTYTAVVLVKLAAAGILNLDDPITTWLPAAIAARIPFADAITIRSLLNHTSGIFDYQDDSDEWLLQGFLPDPVRQWTNADVLPYFLGQPPHFAPLTDVSYSDSNYVLAALIAETASGLPMHELVRNDIVAPLGLQQTVHGDEAQGLSGFVHGYVELDGEILDVYPWYSHYGVSDGGMQASASDLADFVHAALTGDSLLDDEMRAELLTPPEVGNPPSNSGLGFDIEIEAMPGIAIYRNRGKDAGSRADFVHVSRGDQSVTIAWFASASLGSYDVWYEQFFQAVFEVLRDADILPGAQL